ncbi:MAG: hypothetical protein IJZ79_01890 [Bacilli bacterium]|nr:hypothetical protein [Bacilli bacterium]
MQKVPNDQQHILDALAVGDYMYVWQQVKWVGYKKVADINDRYAIFCQVVEKFDYEQNNNFIKFFIDHLKYTAGYDNKTFYVSTNRSIINKLKRENISPTDCEDSSITRELKNWSN